MTEINKIKLKIRKINNIDNALFLVKEYGNTIQKRYKVILLSTIGIRYIKKKMFLL